MGGRTGWKNWINAGARLVLLAAGVYGCLLLLRSSDGIACSPWAVYGGTGVLCLLLWLSAGRGKGCVLALSALLLLGSGAALLLFPETIGGQARALAGAFLGQGEGGGTSVTAALFLAGAVLAAVVSLLEFVLGDHWLLYLLTTALLLLPPFFGTDTELAPVLLLALFQLAFWGLRMAETDRKRFSFGGGDRRKLTGACGAVTGLIVAAVLVISLVSVYPNAQQFYGAVYAGEGMVYRTARQVTGRADEPVANGYISRGNNYRTGTVQLRLTASRQPGETLYLRGFAGGTYGDSHWEAADDRSLFLDISDEMGWGSWGTWLNGVFSSMYFMLNSTAEAEGRAEPVSLNIQHTAGGIRPLYTPYYSRWDYQRDYQQDGASEQAAARLPGYSFQYYEQQDMDVDWTRQTREMEESAEWFRQIQDIYGRDPDGLHPGAKGGGAVAGGPVQGASGIGPGGGHLGDPLCPGK